MKTRIQIGTIGDLAELLKLSIETFEDTFAADNDPADFQEYLAEAFTQEKLKTELLNPDSRFFFIYSEEKLAGYMKLNVGAAQTERSGKNDLEVERLYIRKNFKRQGLGKQLLELAIETAKKEKRENIWLGVWEENLKAQRFYQTLGFRQIGAHDFYIGSDKQTDLLMAKKLL